ncbi:c-type cytochrome [Aromatoleum diolicum]|uniref:Cytochrome c5 family protein n=1 Tax=Aromatoleum diolicum TaxID=75796 RepID=A0ABX1QI82_9RHOO|nr:c-type cytochrome [Aromatoleum diolicum]NMG77277.1 cytochrome c5 family protein [Aromatoleum diolicum]
MKHFVTLLGLFLLSTASNVTAADGKAIYTQICRACHATGVAGAPVLGDRTAWAARLPVGFEALLQSALRGKGGMPPKGGNAGLTDDQVREAVAYMIAQSQ